MKLIEYIRRKELGFPKTHYFDTAKNLYDTLHVLPNFGRSLKVTPTYENIPSDPNNYYIVRKFKPDRGVNYASKATAIILDKFVGGIADRHKGIKPERFLCLPWKCIQNIQQSTSIYESKFEDFTTGQSKENFLDSLQSQFLVVATAAIGK